MQAKALGTIIRQGQRAPPKVLIGTRPVVRPQVKRGEVDAVHHVVGQEVLAGVQGPLVLAILQEGTCSAYPQQAVSVLAKHFARLIRKSSSWAVGKAR